MGDAPPVTFLPSDPITVVAHTERIDAGLDHWVDGTMGIVRKEGRTLVLAPNGTRTARHHLHEGGFVAGLQDPGQPIANMRTPVDHASGGPLWRDPQTGVLVLVYHAERFRGGDPADYWSFLGIAISDDEGATFLDLGPVLTCPGREQDNDRVGPAEVGPGSFVERDGWIYLYFMDRAILTTTTGLGVCRIAVEDLQHAVSERRTPQFAKYHQGRFGEPGIAGASTDLLPDDRYRVIWFDVAHLREPDLIVLVHSTVAAMSDATPLWNHVVRTSSDGIDWSEPRLLYPASVPAELIYLTLDSRGADQRSVAGRSFDLYRITSESDFRWDEAALERLTVTWEYGDTDG